MPLDEMKGGGADSWQRVPTPTKEKPTNRRNWGSEFGSGEAEKALTYELTAALTRAQQLDQGQGGD